MIKTIILLCVFSTICFAQLFGNSICEDGTCNDNDFCTGTKEQPDYCEDGKCISGPPICDYYIKYTVFGNQVESGILEVTNDDKWLYLSWRSTSDFLASTAFLYVARDPLENDDSTKFPFQIQDIEPTNLIQFRVSLQLLENPTEFDAIYIALRLENKAGADSWMTGLFTPVRHHHGGSYSYTSVCHCIGYSHVENLIDRSKEIYTFSTNNTEVEFPTQQSIQDEVDAASFVYVSFLLLLCLVFV